MTTTAAATLHATTPISGPAEALRRLGVSRDTEAWAWLCAELGPQLRSLTGRLSADAPSADDALQETLLTVRDHAGQFRPRLDPDADARHWLLRVAANAALGLARRHRRAQLRAAQAPLPSPESASSSARLERDEQSQQVRLALAGLGERERTAIVLRVIEDLEYRDIAATLGCAEGTVKSLVSRGLARLRSRLGRPELSLLTLGVELPTIQAPGPLAPSSAGLLHAHLTATRGSVPAGGGITLAATIGLSAAALLALAVPLLWAWQRAAPSMPVASTAAAPAAPTAAQPPAAPSAPASAPPVAALSDAIWQHTLSFAFADTDMPDVVSYLRQVAGLRIAVDPALIAPMHLTLKASQMTLMNVLRWTFVRRHLRVRVSDHALSIDRAPVTTAPPGPDEVTLGPVLALDRAPAVVREQLAQQVHVEFQQTSVPDVMTFIQHITNLNIMIDPDLAPDALGSTTLFLDHTLVSEVLTQACAQHGLIATWTDGAVFITKAPVTPTLPHASQ